MAAGSSEGAEESTHEAPAPANRCRSKSGGLPPFLLRHRLADWRALPEVERREDERVRHLAPAHEVAHGGRGGEDDLQLLLAVAERLADPDAVAHEERREAVALDRGVGVR